MRRDYHIKYRFIKPVECSEGTFKPGDEITFVGNRCYFNDGMVMPAFYNMMVELVRRCEEDPDFNCLRRVPIPYNKC